MPLKRILVLVGILALGSLPGVLHAQVAACNSSSSQSFRSCIDDSTVSTSGGFIRITNNGGLTPAFEEVISGSPTTISVVIQGCGTSGTCDTLDTYTTVANAVRAPTISKLYAYYYITASWTGGTKTSVRVITMITSARNSGGGSVVNSINAVTGAFTFTGNGVTCSSTTCTFSGVGGMKTRTGSTGEALDAYSGYQTIYNSSSAVAVTISAPSALSTNYVGIVTNRGTGTVTITPASGVFYVNGVSMATLVLAVDQTANIALDPDGTDFVSQRSLIAGTNITIDSTGAINASSSGSGSNYIYGAASSTTTAAGNVEVQAGVNTGGGPTGLMLRTQEFNFTGTYTQWTLACQSTAGANTVTNCAASPYVVVGVMYSQPTSSTVLVAMEGSTVPIVASAAVTVGHTACAGATAGDVTDSGYTIACQLQQTIGIVQAITGTWLAFPDGTAFPTLSSTLPLVLLKNISPTFYASTSYSIPKYSTIGSGLWGSSSFRDNGVSVYGTEPTFTIQGHGLDISTSAVSITSTSFVTTGYYLPATTTIAANANYIGMCHAVWQQATAAGGVQFALATSAAPTHMIVTSVSNPPTLTGGSAYSTADITTATTTAVTTQVNPAAIATTYFTDLYVTLSQSTTANTITLYALTENASDALSILPGTYCKW